MGWVEKYEAEHKYGFKMLRQFNKDNAIINERGLEQSNTTKLWTQDVEAY